MGVRGTVVAALALLLLSPRSRAGEPHEDLARAMAPKLSERGYAVDLSKLRVEVKSVAAMEADIRKQQGILLPPDFLKEFAHLTAALSKGGSGRAPDDAQVAELEASTVRALIAAVPAYYQPGEGRLVFKKPESGDPIAALANPNHIVAHEMVHAHQDQVRGLETMFRRGRKTREQARLMSCLLEGEAEAVAFSLSCDLLKLEESDLATDLERVLAGETLAILYSAGRTFMVARFREGGWPAVAAALDRPPPSTEQVLHPEKLGQDEPTPVTLPDIGMPVWIEDVVGELDIYRQLTLLGADRTEAWTAATGWDGDLLRIHRDREGGEVILWRTLWDRPEDAEQFAKLLTDRAGGTAARRGRLVDWRWATSEDLGAAADAALASSGQSPAVVEEDAASAAAAEKAGAARSAGGSERRGDEWVVPASGIRIPIPAGWEFQEVQGVKVLVDVASVKEAGFGANINCQSMPLPAGTDVDALLEENRKQISSMPGWSLDFIEKTQVDGFPAVRYGFHGRMNTQAGTKALRFLGLILLRSGRQEIITGTTTESFWERHKDLLAKTLAGIRVEKNAGSGGR